MPKKYNWGILGPGNIAHKFSAGLKLLGNANLYAVASRSVERAAGFARQHGFDKYFGSYQEMVADPDLDVVYIASPHSHHMEHTLLCLENWKHVLCEKAFAINSAEVEKMTAMATQRNLFLMEALWPPFQPSYLDAREVLASGRMGEVQYIRSHFAFKAPYDPEGRLFNPSLGGGALLDIGIYPVIDAITFMGKPSSIEAQATFTDSGVDHTIQITMDYGNGKYASLYASLNNQGGIGTELFCDNGVITLSRSRDLTQTCIVETEDKEPLVHRFKPDAMGYPLVAMEVMDCLDRGVVQSSTVPLSLSRDIIETLDAIRKKINLVYPEI